MYTDIARSGDFVKARFEKRLNRFVVRVRIDQQNVEAYLPNTARLRDLLQPGAWVYLKPSRDPNRKTRYTLVRFVDDGVLVSAEAAAAADTLDAYLRRSSDTPFGRVRSVEREVSVEGSRLDFRLTTADGERWWVEVKSLSRVYRGVAHFSGTPSQRGWEHLRLLGRLVARGERAAAVFVVQREDARLLAPAEETDPGWVAALREAAAAGVCLVAFSCRVTLDQIEIVRQIPVSLERAL
jgi:sugar fermentation stimulation protein A